MAEIPNTPDMSNMPDLEPLAGAQMNHASPLAPASFASPVERRLTSDGERWARGLPAADALTAWANALPEPSADARPTATLTPAIRSTRGAPIATPTANVTSAPIVAPDVSPSKGRQPMFLSRFGGVRILAPVAAVLVVALMGAVFVALAGGGHTTGFRAKPRATATVIRRTPTVAPATSGVFAGAQAQHLGVVVATSVNKQFQPITTGYVFHRGEKVDILVTLEDPSSAVSHTITLVWLSNGRPYGTTSATVAPYSVSDVAQHGKPAVGFSVAYTAIGTGSAKIYWDAQNPNAPNDDNALAQLALFIVQ